MGHLNPIEELLKKKDIPYSIQGKDYVVKCLNPEHNDTNPSMRIDRVDGRFHCFSCQFRGSIFKHFGLLTTPNSVRISKLKAKLNDLFTNSNGLEMLEGAIPYTRSFRGISNTTLLKYGAFYTNAIEKLVDRIIFPITDVRGKIMVFVARHTMSNGNPRYLLHPGNIPLFAYPQEVEKGSKSVVLVEGIFDMLNLRDKGMQNVVCTFGTSTLFADTAEKLLAFKTQGITKIYLLYDGDTPGREATAKLEPLLQEAGYSTEIIDIDDDTDPGDLSEETIQRMKDYINEKDSNN